MDRGVPHLPTGRAVASALPQHIHTEHQHADSTGSQDSIMTQVPLPYHMPDVFSQDSSYFATPDLTSHDTFDSFGANVGRPRTTSLNPTSAPYTPSLNSGYPPTFDNNYNPRGSFSFPAPPPPPGQMNSQGLHAEQQYYAQGDMMGGPVGGAQFQSLYDAQMGQGTYGHFPVAYGINQYPPQVYGMNPQVPPPTQYPQPAALSSPAMSYTSASTQGWNTMSYGPPQQGNSILSAMPYAQHQSASGINSQQPWGHAYGGQNQYGGTQQPRNPVLPSNANRGKPVVRPPPPDVRRNNTRTPNMTGGYSTIQNTQKQKAGQHNHGGPVLPPASKTSGISSPTKSKVSQASSSHDFQSQDGNHAGSQNVSQVASEDEEDSISDLGSPTPGPTHRNQFGSRNTQTPVLRSRRGQSIAASATDPPRKTVTAEWLDKLPLVDGVDSEKTRTPPPKMMSLLNNAIIGQEVSRLRSLNDADPFTGGPRAPARDNVPLLNNPFAPHQLTAPYNSFVHGQNSGMSAALRLLTDNGKTKPSIDEALDTKNLPFAEYCRMAKVDEWGVIKIKNIPYCVNRPEVLAFLGRNARIISEQDYEPVHIVMERVTSKTLDCYVEFISFNEAVAAVNRFETNRSGGRGGRLGQRHVDVELSSQESLMKDLFPKAKNVHWQGSKPMIIPTDPNDKYNSGFQGFISKEELVMLVKHVEAPQRSPFSKECPQRPFECLISTLLKYPWYMVDYITIEDRNLLFEATMKLLELLRDRLDGVNASEDINITPMLYKRVWRAALKCPGFTPTMKDDVVFKCHIDETLAQEIGVPLFASEYRFMWTIGPKPGAPHDLILWYAAVIREHTSVKEQLSLAEKAAKGEKEEGPKLFGNLEKYFGLPTDPKVFKHWTLAQTAANEWSGIETVLRQALTPALEGPVVA